MSELIYRLLTFALNTAQTKGSHLQNSHHMIPSLRNRLSLSNGVPGTHHLPLPSSILMLRRIVNVLYRKQLKVILYGLQCLLFLAPGKYAQMFCF